jgi:hypothetical protein
LRAARRHQHIGVRANIAIDIAGRLPVLVDMIRFSKADNVGGYDRRINA